VEGKNKITNGSTITTLIMFQMKGIGDAVEDYLCNQSDNIRLVAKQTAKIDHVLQNLKNSFVELIPKKDFVAVENRNVPTLLQLLRSSSEKVKRKHTRTPLLRAQSLIIPSYKRRLMNWK